MTMAEPVGFETGHDGDANATREPAEQPDWEEWLTQHGDLPEAGEGSLGSAEGDVSDPYEVHPEAAPAREPGAETTEDPALGKGWEESIRQLVEWGVTPEQLAAELQALRAGEADDLSGRRQPTESPEEQFARWLAQREIKPEECSRAELISLEGAWRQEQLLAHYQAQVAAAQEQALRAQWLSDLQMVEREFPELGNPVLRDALLNLYEGRYGIDANYERLAEVAGELMGTIRTLSQAELARYARAKQEDAAFPVFAGGNSPAPHPVVDFHQLSPSMQQEFLESHFAAAGVRPD
jgi:hypothetical protein